LARRSNSFTDSDYKDGLKVLQRISERKLHGIVVFRNAASREVLPAYQRPSPDDPPPLVEDTGDFLLSPETSELTMKSLCQAKAILSLPSSPKTDDDGEPFPLPYVVPDDEGLDIPRVERSVLDDICSFLQSPAGIFGTRIGNFCS
jgi:hypothetical protein